MRGGLLNSFSLGFISSSSTWHPNAQLTNWKTVPLSCREQIYKPSSEISIWMSVCWQPFGHLQYTALISINNSRLPGEAQPPSADIPLAPVNVCPSQVSHSDPVNIRVWATRMSSPGNVTHFDCFQCGNLASFPGSLHPNIRALWEKDIVPGSFIKYLLSFYYVLCTVPESRGGLNKRQRSLSSWRLCCY